MPEFAAPDPSETDLVLRAKDGDSGAFGDLYERHLRTVYRYIACRIDDRHDVEDLTENVFVRAWEAIARYQPSGVPFRVWLLRIAHNQVVDRYRGQRPVAELTETQIDPDAVDIELQLAAFEEQALLRRLMRRLNDEYQQVLALRFVSQLSHAEAAAVLERTEGAVRVMQHRALAALRQLLESARQHA